MSELLDVIALLIIVCGAVAIGYWQGRRDRKRHLNVDDLPIHPLIYIPVEHLPRQRDTTPLELPN